MIMRQGSGMRFLRLMAAAALLVTSLLSGATGVSSAFAASDDPGAVYLITNAPSGNEVAMFARAADGTLTSQGTISTEGLGTGNSLSSQGSVILSDNNRWLFAVNAGSNDISTFEVLPDGLRFIGRFPSDGSMPVSLTVHGNMLYILNAGGSGNIAGFWVNGGVLSPIAGSVQPLSNDGVGAAPGPAQVQFNSTGSVLVVTEKTSNLIDTYVVGGNGAAEAPAIYPSAGSVPYGFDIDRQNHVVVSEAQGGTDGTGASSYALGSDGSLTVVSGAVPDGQGAACWLVISKNGRFAYTANATTNNLSGYSIAQDGSLTLMQQVAATGTGPLDLDISVNGSFLYILDGASDTIHAFRVEADGMLTPITVNAPVAATAIGLAAR
jgi:6-phosphogluconolactonase